MEQNWCNTPRVSLLGLVLLSCSIFLFHVISAQHSLSYPWDLARIMPAWHHPLEAFPACPGAAVGAGSELWDTGSHLSPCTQLEVRLVLQQVLRLLRSSHTHKCGALCLEPGLSSLNSFTLRLDSAARSPWQKQLQLSHPLFSLSQNSHSPFPGQRFPQDSVLLSPTILVAQTAPRRCVMVLAQTCWYKGVSSSFQM